MPISIDAARELAYYKSALGIGVLAPRGWYCFQIYGSGGNSLYVSPEPIDSTRFFSSDHAGFAGPAIEISNSIGDTSGRFTVAEIIARVFPAYRAFVANVAEMLNQPASSIPSGPNPTDTLIYRSKTMVEYRTPAQTEGLGTRSMLKKNGDPIDGVAILTGDTPDLRLLSVRLPSNKNGLAAVVLRSKWSVSPSPAWSAQSEPGRKVSIVITSG